MLYGQAVGVVIPTLDEERSIGRVLMALPAGVDRVVVADNGSTDQTTRVAAHHGAQVVHERRRGYGAACLAGIAAMGSGVDVVAFLDADLSDHPEQLDRLVAPIAAGRADLVIGSRTLGQRERGALNTPQRFGNALACSLIRMFWGHHYTDLGPFRAIRADALAALRMDDQTFGWTVQMQIRALRAGLRVLDVPVDYRRRIGRSKISGTVSGVVRAGTKIIGTIVQERLRPARLPRWTPERHHVIVFTRYPRPGTTKTRMIPALGPDGAADLQRRMTLHTLAIVDRVVSPGDVSHEVRYTDGTPAELETMFGTGRTYRKQRRGALGARIAGAFADAFAGGAAAVVAIGCDCPPLEPRIVESAFEELRRRDVVIGPARDGGYYLIGLRGAHPELFQDIAWGTDAVYAQTLAQAARHGLAVGTLPVLDDVDQPHDLPIWYKHRSRYAGKAPAQHSSAPVGENHPHPPATARPPLLSVVIPTMNEAACIGDAIRSAQQADAVEIIVADGGSRDETTATAARLGAVVVSSPPGRGCQMNAGAAVARGEILLFLHADCTLPPGYLGSIRAAFEDPEVTLTAFALSIDPPTRSLCTVARLANLRSRWLGRPYGDQGLAVRAPFFRRSGGFKDWPLMEDFEFVSRAGRWGRIRMLEPAVCASGRRWLSCGVVKTTLVHGACVAGYVCGFSPQRLASWREACGKRTPAACAGVRRSPSRSR